MNRREFLAGLAVVAAGTRMSAAEEAKSAAPSSGFSLTVLNPDCMVGGAGLCVVLRMPSGRTYLYDTGNGDCSGRMTKNNGKDLVAPWLRAHGIARIDGLVISHYHADHFGGFLWLKDNFPIARIFNNDYTPSLDGLREHDVQEYRVPRAALTAWGAAHPGCLLEGTKFGDDLGWSEPGVQVDVVWPPKEGPVKPLADRKGYTAGDNHFHPLLNGNSTALRIVADGRVFLIAGDIQADYCAAYMKPYLQARGLWGADFLVLPAHGTKAAEEAELVADMSPRPKAVVASLGNVPWMAGAGRDAVRVFTGKGCAAYATNLHGDVSARVENGRLAVSCAVENVYAHDPR